MPNPFPGMNPYIEWRDRWPGFHQNFLVRCLDQLNTRLPADYVATLGERIELVAEDDELRHIRSVGPDIAIVREPGNRPTPVPVAAGVATLEPTTLPNMIEFSDPPVQMYVEITYLPDEKVVTDIRLLSPSNKRVGSKDRPAYLAKHDGLVIREVNLVEIDLLLGGTRSTLRAPLPAGDYYTFITHGPNWWHTDVYSWTMRDALPRIPVPLKQEHAPVPLDLGEAFAETFDHSRYDRILRYDDPPASVSPADRSWIAERLAATWKV